MRIILAGGGSAGHITPSLAIADIIRKKIPFTDILFIVSRLSLDQEILKSENEKFKRVFAGKLRKYFDFRNFFGIFFFLIGIFQCIKIINSFRPDVVFIKGGYVGFPVAVACMLFHIPFVVHESDIIFGATNRLVFGTAKKVCLGFPLKQIGKNIKIIDQNRFVYTGNPVRALELTTPIRQIKMILVLGGSQGAKKINDVIKTVAPELLKKYKIIHITGKNKKVDFNDKNYKQIEYVLDKTVYFKYLAQAELVISRAGANSIQEIIYFKKLNILIPLSPRVSKHQELNALYMEKKGASLVVKNKDLSSYKLLKTICRAEKNKLKILAKIKQLDCRNAAEKIAEIIIKNSR